MGFVNRLRSALRPSPDRKSQRPPLGRGRMRASVGRFAEKNEPGRKWSDLTRREKRRAMRVMQRKAGHRNPPAMKGICPMSQRRALQKVIAAKLRAHEDPNNDYELPYYDGPKARWHARRARQLDRGRAIRSALAQDDPV